MSHSIFDDFVNQLEMPDASCDQVHPVVEQFLAEVEPENSEWSGEFSEWMEQANSCLTNELVEMLGEAPTDPDELQGYLWSVVRVSWLFYRRFNDGEPFNT